MTERQFHTAYLSLAETLYRIAFYMLESEAEAEDALQELYLKLWDNRDSLDAVRSPKAYSITKRKVKRGDTLKLTQARGGGFAVSLMPIK